MYTKQEENSLLDIAKQFQDTEIGIDSITQLRSIIEYADWKYYVQDNPVLADYEYDVLFKKLQTLEDKNPHLITDTSPTQRVAKGLNANFPTVTHLVPMLSLENSYDEHDLIDWDRKCKELSGENLIHYCIEPKFDGASISLIYENDKLLRAATRGNGIEGDDITANAKQIRSIPLQAPISNYHLSQIEIRGEVIITKKRFEAYNNILISQGEQPLANARNAASGSLRIKDPQAVAKRNLDAFLYNISFTNQTQAHSQLVTHYGMLQALSQIGFKTSFEQSKVLNTIEEVIAYVQEFEAKRDELPYEIDGMVIKVNDMHLQEKIGQTSHHPRWAIAFKFKARQATSTLLDIEYQVGRTGSITPVAKISPVAVGGVTISSLSLFNEDVVREKQLMKGDTVLIERAGDVIPYVVKSFPELRKGSEEQIVFPTTCPACNETLFKPDEEAVWRCVNVNCKAQVIERIIHFASKDAMDIRGLGDALVHKFYEKKFLQDISGIYHLPFEEIKKQDGFGEKSMLNLKEAIEKSKNQPLQRLIFALGIRYVGETTAKALARTITHISELYNKSQEELTQIEDVGAKVANSIVAYFSHQANRDLILALEKMGVSLSNQQKDEAISGNLTGKTFLFTGTLSMKRSEAEGLAEKHGGVIISGVSAKLNYLVVGQDAGSKLEKAKKLDSIHILTEEEFLQLIAN